MSRFLKFIERFALVAGFSLIVLVVTVWLDGQAHSRSAISEFERIRDRVATAAEQSDWSPQRKAEYEHSLQVDAGETLAVLRIPARNIEVPVFDSIDETALNRGVGHVAGDGFFRRLKDIEVGDAIQLTTINGQQEFRVSQLDIVDPLDVSVLDPTDETVITLITCYPFYYLGAAPDRFIVRATLDNQGEH